MRTRYVTLMWDGRPREFEQDKCDTAYLVMLEIVGEEFVNATTFDLKVKKMIAKKLRDNHGFDLSEAFRYAIAVTNCGYSPSSTPVSSIGED